MAAYHTGEGLVLIDSLNLRGARTHSCDHTVFHCGHRLVFAGPLEPASRQAPGSQAGGLSLLEESDVGRAEAQLAHWSGGFLRFAGGFLRPICGRLWRGALPRGKGAGDSTYGTGLTAGHGDDRLAGPHRLHHPLWGHRGNGRLVRDKPERLRGVRRSLGHMEGLALPLGREGQRCLHGKARAGHSATGGGDRHSRLLGASQVGAQNPVTAVQQRTGSQ